MCCLAYEQKSYEYLNAITPQVGSIVRTPDGEGTVIETNVVAGTLKVRSNVEILAPRIYKREECVYIRGGKRAPQPADPEVVLPLKKIKIWHLPKSNGYDTLCITQ